MGKFAQSKEQYIDKDKHKIFKTVHPSPLSASRGFFGCDVFLSINKYCKEKNID
jgi:uracil-DNA glycosylase